MSPVLSFTLLLSLGMAYLDGPDHDIVGTWEFVSAKVVSSDGSVLELTNQDLQSTKILNQTHFCVVTRNADGSFRHTNHGPYKLEGSLYTETVEYSTNRAWIGSTPAYKSVLDGDLWSITDAGPTSTGSGEVWRRVTKRRETVEF